TGRAREREEQSDGETARHRAVAGPAYSAVSRHARNLGARAGKTVAGAFGLACRVGGGPGQEPRCLSQDPPEERGQTREHPRSGGTVAERWVHFVSVRRQGVV